MCLCDQLRKLVAQVRPVGRMSLEPWYTYSAYKKSSYPFIFFTFCNVAALC